MNLAGFCRLCEVKALRVALIGVFAAAILFVVVSGTERALRGSSEFRGFRRIVQVAVVEDKDHYGVIGHLRAYPPFFAIFWVPFGVLPVGDLPDDVLQGTSLSQQLQFGASAALLLSVMMAFTVWAVRSVTRASAGCLETDEASDAVGLERRASRWRAWCRPSLLWLLSGGLMMNSIVRCETDMFVVMLVAGSMCLMFAREKPWEGGALLGVAAALKLTPGLFGVYLLCRRKWKALAGMAVAAFACAAVLPTVLWGFEGNVARHRSWAEKVLIPYATEGPECFIEHAYRRANQSLKAAVVRYLTDYNAGRLSHPRYVNVAHLTMSSARRVALVLKVLVLGLLVAAWTLAPASPEGELGPMLFALVPTGMLLLSDVSVGGHMAILVIPFGALMGFCFRHEGERVASRASWVLLCGAGLAHLIALERLKELSVGTAAVVATFAATLYIAWWVWRRRPAAAPGQYSTRASLFR